MNEATATPSPSDRDRRFRVSVNGESIECAFDALDETCRALTDKHPTKAGTLRVVDVTDPLSDDSTRSEDPQPVSTSSASTTNRNACRGVSAEGRARALAARESAIAGGFTPRQPIYETGRLVNDWGIDNAAESRREHDAKPKVGTACDDFVSRIGRERRRDVTFELAGIAMHKTGRIILPESVQDVAESKHVEIDKRSLSQLLSRLTYLDEDDEVRPMKSVGGGDYLSKCWPELRARNVNNWLERFRADEEKLSAIEKKQAALERRQAKTVIRTVVARLRDNPASTLPEIFGWVTERYGSFDVDKIAEAVKLATPEEARAEITYDGRRAQFEVMFHSNVEPANYVTGEFFKAGVRIRTDDSGGGSIGGSSLVWQNLCLNLLIIDECGQEIFRIRHTGSVEDLAEKFRLGFERALGSIDHFLKAWNYATEENVVEHSAGVTDEPIGSMRIEDVLPGFFTAIVERDLVKVRGRTDVIVPKLMEAYNADESAANATGYITRAGIVNAFTRYAHSTPQPSPWHEDQIERGAGRLLWGRSPGKTPEPLPWQPFETKKRTREQTS